MTSPAAVCGRSERKPPRSAEGVTNALNKPKDGTAVSDQHRNTASTIIVTALSDSDLFAVRSVISDSVSMFEKLDESFDSRSTATKIFKISEFVFVLFSSINQDITKHMDHMAAILEQLN